MGVLQVLSNGAAHKGQIAVTQVGSTLLRIIGLFCIFCRAVLRIEQSPCADFIEAPLV